MASAPLALTPHVDAQRDGHVRREARVRESAAGGSSRSGAAACSTSRRWRRGRPARPRSRRRRPGSWSGWAGPAGGCACRPRRGRRRRKVHRPAAEEEGACPLWYMRRSSAWPCGRFMRFRPWTRPRSRPPAPPCWPARRGRRASWRSPCGSMPCSVSMQVTRRDSSPAPCRCRRTSAAARPRRPDHARPLPRSQRSSEAFFGPRFSFQRFALASNSSAGLPSGEHRAVFGDAVGGRSSAAPGANGEQAATASAAVSLVLVKTAGVAWGPAGWRCGRQDGGFVGAGVAACCPSRSSRPCRRPWRP